MHDKKMAIDVKSEMASRGVMIKDVAEEMNRHRNTIRLWLLQGMNQVRHDGMIKAIERIVEKREEMNK